MFSRALLSKLICNLDESFFALISERSYSLTNYTLRCLPLDDLLAFVCLPLAE